jgi:type IX secretion system PorP/SprF family membrane protein
MYIFKKRYYSLIYLLLFLGTHIAQSQIYGNNFSNQYFQNKFLINPAFAGEDSTIWVQYRTNNVDVEGRPRTFAFTADMPLKKLGVGFSMINDKSGNFSTIRLLGSVSYIAKFKNNKILKMGLSMGYYRERLDGTEVTDANVLINPKFLNYTNRPGMFDGNTGVAFIYNNMNFAIGLPSFKFLGNSSVVDNSIVYASASYKLESNFITFMPMIYYQLFKHSRQTLDLGGQVELLNSLFFTGMFNTSVGGALIGVGYKHIDKFKVTFYYNTVSTAAASTLGGAFEVGFAVYPQALF